ncbi:MAG: class I SAM-dependent methyltransferase [Candidatus Hodarchaeales archaeon]|jgi:ubiquinone/menaquinone biosynthesis C-methylase UbiE
MDSITRFTTKAKKYHKYRPRYPEKIIDILISKTDLSSSKSFKVADIGSGTGILSELFLKNGNTVFGVEPNNNMRQVAERMLKHYSNFISVKGTAERTNINDIVDMITAGQSFHWFEIEKARKEFKRILKTEGYVVLIWNQRKNLTTPFGREIEEILNTYGKDYVQVKNHEKNIDFKKFFGTDDYTKTTIHNTRMMSYEELQGRLVSISCIPDSEDPKYPEMVKKVQSVFAKYQGNGIVKTEYDTEIYFGEL